MTRILRLSAASLSAIILVACGDGSGAHAGDVSGASATAASTAQASPQTRPLDLSRTEAALVDQISCVRPPQAGVAMSAMLRNHLIATTADGGDGIELFVPVEAMQLFGFDIVRFGGWQPHPDGGAMAPFSRGPGTAPPNHLSITVRASEQQVRQALSRAGISEARYVPDNSQAPFTSSDGRTYQPRRLIPGPEIEAGDNSLTYRPLPGVTTITCSANDYDFQREIEDRFGSQ